MHRNRSSLLEILGKRKTQNKIPRIELEKRKFSFKYHTHININSVGKTYYFLYDIAWMEFSDDEVLIIKRMWVRFELQSNFIAWFALNTAWENPKSAT